MQQIKGPAIFLAQFMADSAPYNSLESLCQWAADKGFKGIQLPTDPKLFDLEQAASSQSYCDNITEIVTNHGLAITELSTHLQGQLVAVHPAYDAMFDGFAPPQYRGNPAKRTQWAISQLKHAAVASQRLGLKAHATFSGALLWQTIYPWPQRPAGLVELGFKELAARWRPILDTFDTAEVDVCFELHPGEDLHDGASFERFLAEVDFHPRANILYDPSHFVLQQLDYLAFIDIYHERIKAFHVKDAEFTPNGRSGVYGGYQSWQERPGRFRSLGDGQINFKSIFSKLTQYGYQGWAVLEWECCLKHPEDGASEGAKYIEQQLIRPTDKQFDDFAAVETNLTFNQKLLGL
ncbi:Sugar phosphate isomerase/epimerase [Shewanella piezotolerans WP3]|uniref:Sugar phosphate isomerase/epimerase n=1 Tax=Shewanella piezotolerans (strain WP3 / JCM 13877) TaxID=225849 RepID=B8CUL3_SHEPW|nr:sugar phosphate isomerase/epimerase [Shewanella piezotolerans]ACJ31205.1 Sugar phosphate isomerase/epimerase [Shewanella piezotolerans WP3]